MQNKVEIEGIRLFAYHGCLEEEGKLGGKYTVNVSLTTDFSKAKETDNLHDTVDYVQVREIVAEEMSIRSNLIEHVGYRINQRLKKEINSVACARVEVIKHNPPIDGDVDFVKVVIEE